MSDALSAVERAALLSVFQGKRAHQQALAGSHEAAGSYAMAYLAMWAVLEFFARRLGPVALRLELRAALEEWQAFAEGRLAKPPAKISAGKFDLPTEETAKIPPEGVLQRLLPMVAAPNFYRALSPAERFRRRRNEIAHSGVAISQKVYAEFNAVAAAALDEIDAWLSAA